MSTKLNNRKNGQYTYVLHFWKQRFNCSVNTINHTYIIMYYVSKKYNLGRLRECTTNKTYVTQPLQKCNVVIFVK